MVSQRYSQNSQKVTPKKSAFDLRRSWWCNRLRRRWNTQWQHLSDDGNGTVFPQTLEILSPRKRTWLAGKFSTIWRCISVFKMVMFHCHVSFREVITRLSNFYTLIRTYHPKHWDMIFLVFSKLTGCLVHWWKEEQQNSVWKFTNKQSLPFYILLRLHHFKSPRQNYRASYILAFWV